MKEQAIVVGPHLGELFWEFYRFSPILPYKYKIYGDSVKYIIFTRPDRFDLYGKYADILVPLRIDETKYRSDCHRLTSFPKQEWEDLIKKIHYKYSQKFKIIEHIYPDLNGRNFCNKNQFPRNKMVYKWKPRSRNKELLDNFIPSDKELITLAPRFRQGMSRNWPHWQKLYDLIKENKFLSNYNFALCGKDPDYIPDKDNTFFDVNHIEQDTESSTIGLTIECLKRSILTVGSQSGIPNISLILGTQVIEWGHQKSLHTITYNDKKTPVVFLDDHKYKIPPEVVVVNICKMLEKLRVKK